MKYKLNNIKHKLLEYILYVRNNNYEHIKYISNFTIYLEPPLSLFRVLRRFYFKISVTITLITPFIQ